MGRPAILDQNPALLDTFVELLADGRTRAEIASAMGCSKEAVSLWKKRSDVQAKLAHVVTERANRVLSHTDSRIVKRLESGKEIPLRELLEIRRTFAGEKVELTHKGAKGDALLELMQKLHDSPDLAREFGAVSADEPEPE
jgi:transposase